MNRDEKIPFYKKGEKTTFKLVGKLFSASPEGLYGRLFCGVVRQKLWELRGGDRKGVGMGFKCCWEVRILQSINSFNICW